MNKEILKGNWKQAKGKVKEVWGKFTDDEVEQMDGNYDQLVGKVQEKYGYTKDKAASSVNDFMTKINKSMN